jgi:hypothetical protein
MHPDIGTSMPATVLELCTDPHTQQPSVRLQLDTILVSTQDMCNTADMENLAVQDRSVSLPSEYAQLLKDTLFAYMRLSMQGFYPEPRLDAGLTRGD